MNNPLHQAIYEKIVKPAIEQKTFEAEGLVVEVLDANYVNILCRLPDGIRKLEEVRVSNGAKGGIFSRNVEKGDYVKVAFQGGDVALPFVTTIFKELGEKDFFAPYGSSIPRSI